MNYIENTIEYLALFYILFPILFFLGIIIFLFTGRKLSIEWADKYLGFIKWYLVSVALVFSTNIISKGFTERETGIKEMQVYDKYANLILEANNIESRWKLAQYFSAVTPTDRLRDRWIDYKNTIQGDYQAYKKILAQEKDTLDEQAQLKQQKSLFEQPLVPKTKQLLRVDVFYLEETMISHNSQQKAEEIALLLNPRLYNTSVKMISKLTNAKVGYRINKNQIRNEESELIFAKQIRAIIGDDFELKTIDYSTPNYISVFVYN